MTNSTRLPLEKGDSLYQEIFPIVAGGFEVRLAQSPEELREAQRLRYQVFFEETGIADSSLPLKDRLQQDSFDAFSDHLVTVEKNTGKIVGTYRFMRRTGAKKHGCFYTAGEFDITPLEKYDGEILELSRTCVHKDYRTGLVMHLLWRGLYEYLLFWDIKILFGCGSFNGTDPQAFAHALSYLHYNHLASPSCCPRALEEHYTPLNLIPQEDINLRKVAQQLPAVLKGYVRVGASIGDGAFIDHQFQTTDVCIIVYPETMTKKYTDYYNTRSSQKDKLPAQKEKEV